MPRHSLHSAIGLMAFALVMLSGCAATRPALDHHASVPPAKLEAARDIVDGMRNTNAVIYQLATAGSAVCAESDPHYRAPFSMLFNAAGIADLEMRNALYALLRVDQHPLLQAHAPSLQQYDGAEIVAINGQSADEQHKLIQVVEKAVDANADLQVTLADGRQLVTRGLSACPTQVLTAYFGPLREAQLVGYKDVTPKGWSQLARNRDEQAFVLARSVYFTAGEGRVKLRNALYAGAAANGALRALTFGLSAIVVDAKTVAVRARRAANRSDADLFAVQLMTAAGFNPAAAASFAAYSLKEGAAWPSDCDELKFDQQRYAELLRHL